MAFGSPVTGDRLFPFYWVSAYGFTDAYLGTAINPTGGYAAFVDDGTPPVLDDVSAFGAVRWYASGSNNCPGTGGGDGLGAGAHFLSGEELLLLPSVHPDVLHAEAGLWTLLVTGIEPDAIGQVTLSINGQEILPNSSSAAGPTASLWDFSYPKLQLGSSAEVLVALSADTLAKPLEIIDADNPSRHASGQVIVRLVPSTIAWSAITDRKHPDHQTRSVAQVPIHDSVLQNLISVIGTTEVSKFRAYTSDGDSTIAGKPDCSPIPADQRSKYMLHFPPQHSVFAIAEILKLSPAVVASYHAPMMRSFSSACDDDIQGDICDQQWELQSSYEFPGGRGVQANYAWCSNRGDGQRIFLIDIGEDTPVPGYTRGGYVLRDHPSLLEDITIPDGYGGEIEIPRLNPYSDACSDPNGLPQCSRHGMMMAAVMSGRVPNEDDSDYDNGVVGVAPNTELFALAPRRYPEVINALETVRFNVGFDLTYLCMPFGLAGLFQWEIDDLVSMTNELKSMHNVAMFAPSAMWDQDNPVYPGWAPAVYGVGGEPRIGGQPCNDPAYVEWVSLVRAPCGYVDHTASPFTTNGWTSGKDENGDDIYGLSFSAAMATGAAAVLRMCAGYNDVTGCYAALEEASSSGKLEIGVACEAVGIEDVRDFMASPGDRECILTWVVEDPEGISEFILYESALCWGPFAEILRFNPGHYTENGVDYEVVRSAEVMRNYHYKLVVTGEGGEVVFDDDCIPDNGDAYTIEGPPGDVQLVATDMDEAELSWSRLSPDYGYQYWIYGGRTESLDDCGPNETQYGGWFLGAVNDYEAPSSFGRVPDKACWYMEDLMIGAPFACRVAVAKREFTPDGPVIWASGLSDEVTVYAVHPAGISDETEDGNLDVKILPLPASSNGEVVVRLLGVKSDDVDIDIYDAGGRRVCGRRVVGGSDAGRAEIRLSLEDGSQFQSGVYFVKARSGSTQRVMKKLVILE